MNGRIIFSAEEKLENVALLAVDLLQAFDMLKHEYLWDALSRIGSKGKILDLIKILYEQSKWKFLINGYLSDFFDMKKSIT